MSTTKVYLRGGPFTVVVRTLKLCLTSLRFARAIKNRMLSELDRRELVDSEVSLRVLERIYFLVALSKSIIVK